MRMGVSGSIDVDMSGFDCSRGTSIPLPSIPIPTPLPSSTPTPIIMRLILIVVAIVSVVSVAIVVVIIVGMCRPTRARTITAATRPAPGVKAAIRSSGK